VVNIGLLEVEYAKPASPSLLLNALSIELVPVIFIDLLSFDPIV
jgi:hypothetical protein